MIHIGILAGLFAVKFWDEKGIWLALLPMVSALYMLLRVRNKNLIIIGNQSENYN